MNELDVELGLDTTGEGDCSALSEGGIEGVEGVSLASTIAGSEA